MISFHSVRGGVTLVNGADIYISRVPALSRDLIFMSRLLSWCGCGEGRALWMLPDHLQVAVAGLET
jgi:hypothetical protein